MDLSQSILNVIDSSAGDKDKGSKVKQQKMLSFKQFVTFLIRGSREATMDPLLSRKEHFNTHWFPYWKLCSPCHPHTLPNTIVKLDEGQFQQEVGTHCLKITQNVAFVFEVWHFPPICPIKTDLSGNTVWPQALSFQKTRQNGPFLAYLINFCPLKM